ncbi:hypothetical protein CSC16_2206 [Proteus mirabilis]|nr:hypothetical protein CSC16_2206 [Proteus mirabilis]KXC00293.1 hypothetical protein HMPREF3203_02199 [Proteus mirabilis]
MLFLGFLLLFLMRVLYLINEIFCWYLDDLIVIKLIQLFL